MQIYTLEIKLRDQEAYSREIEIGNTQKFESLHKLLIEDNKLDSNELASFYSCDENWEKDKEIALLDMTEGEDYVHIMKDTEIDDFAYNLGDKLLYINDFLNMWTFEISLTKNEDESVDGIQYPRVTKSEGMMDLSASNIDLSIEGLSE